MNWVYYLSVWLHLMAAVVWLGAGVFLVIAVVPALKKPAIAPHAGILMRALLSPLRYVGAGALLTFLVTGTYNLHVRFGTALHDAAFWQSSLGKLIGLKLGAFGLICVVAVIHDLWLGPAAMKAGAKDPDSEQTRKLRQAARTCGRFNLLMGFGMLILGILIVRPGWG